MTFLEIETSSFINLTSFFSNELLKLLSLALDTFRNCSFTARFSSASWLWSLDIALDAFILDCPILYPLFLGETPICEDFSINGPLESLTFLVGFSFFPALIESSNASLSFPLASGFCFFAPVFTELLDEAVRLGRGGGGTGGGGGGAQGDGLADETSSAISDIVLLDLSRSCLEKVLKLESCEV